MATGKIGPNTMLLLIDPAGGTAYDTVICLESFNFNRSRNVIDAATMCGPDKQPGNLDVTLDFDGQHFLDADAATISGHDFDTLILNKTTIGWKIGVASPTTGNAVYTGTGFISEFSESFATDQPGKFKGAIGIYSTYTTVITA